MKVLIVSQCLFIKVSWWRQVYSLYMLWTCKTSTFHIGCFNNIIAYTSLRDYVNEVVNWTSSFKRTIRKMQFVENNRISPFAWSYKLEVVMLEIMFSFLHRPIVSLHKIYCQEPRVLIWSCVYMLFWLSKCDGSYWLTFNDLPRTTVSAKNLLYCSTKKNI